MSKHCNYARVAIRTLTQKYHKRGNALAKGALAQVKAEFNEQFRSTEAMQLSYVMATKKIPQIVRAFNQRWHPQCQRQSFLETFSLTAWTRRLHQEKQQHSLRNCTACCEKHLSLTRSFPDQPNLRLKDKLPTITFTKRDFSSQHAFGRKVLGELNAIGQEQFNVSAQQVLCNTPQSHLIHKPSSTERLSEKQKVVRSAKKSIQQAMDESGATTVMGNRISWKSFDRVRKAEKLTNTPSRKRRIALTIPKISLPVRECMAKNYFQSTQMPCCQRLKRGLRMQA